MSQGNRGTSAGKRVLTAEQKRRILQKRRMRRLKKRLMIIVPIAVVLLVALILLLTLGRGDKAHVPDVQAAMSMEMLSDDTAATADASASVEPVVTSTPEPETFDYDEAYVRAVNGEITGPEIVYTYAGIDPLKRERWPEVKEGYIPQLTNARTNDKIIAVTVDDCYQGLNLQKIVDCAISCNAKLTIFPIGDNLTKPEVATGLKRAYENGMEIGNHTYFHTGMFHYDQERLINEVWHQREEVNRTLGFNYTQHFFRPRGGDERDCQRMHAYLSQLGYYGVALWNKSGSSDPMDQLINELAPGNIYLFHTTDNDLEKLLQFIPEAVARGYQLVTMSDMFGLQQNAVSEFQSHDTPELLHTFAIKPQKLSVTTFSRSAAVVQKRLIDLGWLAGEADGEYGRQSYYAVGFFELAVGLELDGIADVEMQKKLFASDAPRGSLEKIQQLAKENNLSVPKKIPGA